VIIQVTVDGGKAMAGETATPRLAASYSNCQKTSLWRVKMHLARNVLILVTFN